MIKFTDSLNIERGIEFSSSYCGKYITKTEYVKDRSSAVQIPYDKLDELIDNLTNLKEKSCGDAKENN